MGARVTLRWASVAADVVAMLAAYGVAIALRSGSSSLLGLEPWTPSPDWSLAILMLSVLALFYASGLYEREAYVSRRLHAWTLASVSLAAFVVSSLAVYLLKLPAVDPSRLVLATTFLAFVPLSCALRLGVIDEEYYDRLRRREPLAFLVGDSAEAGELAERLVHLRGFERLAHVDQGGASALSAVKTAIEALSPDRRSGCSLFIDARSVSPRDVFEATEAAQALGTEVYVMSRLLGPLEGNRLLNSLFEAPVIRVRRTRDSAHPYRLKRAFDLLGSTALLVVCLPVMAVVGVLVRLSSPGPVFHRQTRVGRSGIPFEFLKFRSMVVTDNVSEHAEYVRSFMRGTARPVETDDGRDAVFKRVDDPRITPVGRVLRKYSLDEVPQFWNVLRGDMSLVGPRPPLPYEVSEYDDWRMLRLTVPSGLTGLWQVAGRSRVTFDEMTLQDLMYARNMRLLVDVELCLKTVPAALLGDGGG